MELYLERNDHARRLLHAKIVRRLATEIRRIAEFADSVKTPQFQVETEGWFGLGLTAYGYSRGIATDAEARMDEALSRIRTWCNGVAISSPADENETDFRQGLNTSSTDRSLNVHVAAINADQIRISATSPAIENAGRRVVVELLPKKGEPIQAELEMTKDRENDRAQAQVTFDLSNARQQLAESLLIAGWIFDSAQWHDLPSTVDKFVDSDPDECPSVFALIQHLAKRSAAEPICQHVIGECPACERRSKMRFVKTLVRLLQSGRNTREQIERATNAAVFLSSPALKGEFAPIPALSTTGPSDAELAAGADDLPVGAVREATSRDADLKVRVERTADDRLLVVITSTRKEQVGRQIRFEIGVDDTVYSGSVSLRELQGGSVGATKDIGPWSTWAVATKRGFDVIAWAE